MTFCPSMLGYEFPVNVVSAFGPTNDMTTSGTWTLDMSILVRIPFFDLLDPGRDVWHNVLVDLLLDQAHDQHQPRRIVGLDLGRRLGRTLQDVYGYPLTPSCPEIVLG